MAAAMELYSGERPSEGAGVKVKFIETQFVSSDAANFKSVVQRLTGKHSKMPPPPLVQTSRPRSASSSSGSSVGVGEEERRLASVVSRSGDQMHPKQQAPAAAGFKPARMEMEEQLHELCDFADMFYATPGAWREGGGAINGFPYGETA